MDQPQQRERLARLLADVRPHDVEPGELGEYAEVRFGHGDAAAERAFPGVAAHLRTGCRSCEAELRDFSRVAALWQPDATPAPEPELPWLRVVPRRPAAGPRNVAAALRRRGVLAAVAALAVIVGALLATSLPDIVVASQLRLAARAPQIVFVVDMAPEEMIGLREVLSELEPDLKAKVFLMNVPSDQYVGELDRMVRDERMKWDLIAADNNMVGVLGSRCLVQDLKRYSGPEALVPEDQLIASLSGLSTYQRPDQVLFAPFRPNVMVAFYNKEKFRSLGLSPPRDWAALLDVARRLHADDGVGRVAIQGYPGKPAAVTAFEFVRAAGGDPMTLDDPGSRRAFEFLQELQPYLAPEFRKIRFDTANRALIMDRVDLVVNWTFGIRVVLEDAGLEDEIGVYSGWSGPAGEARVLGGDVLAIPRGAPSPDSAFKLIERLLAPEVQQKLLVRLGWLPVRLDAYTGLPPTVQPIFDQAVKEALSGAELRPTSPQWALMEKELDGAFDALVRQRGPLSALQVYSDNLGRIPQEVARYAVRETDTLQRVAARYGTTPDVLAGVNGIDAAEPVVPGQVLLVPGVERSPCP